jgi:hypothetical protein
VPAPEVEFVQCPAPFELGAKSKVQPVPLNVVQVLPQADVTAIKWLFADNVRLVPAHEVHVVSEPDAIGVVPESKAIVPKLDDASQTIALQSDEHVPVIAPLIDVAPLEEFRQ